MTTDQSESVSIIKILVVDDEPDLQHLVKQKFRRNIRQGQYELQFAMNGREALDIMENETFDIVLSDINMPVMDGLTLLGELGKVNPVMKAIIVSAYGDMKNIRIAMNKGAFDFITKPIDFKDLERTIEKTYNYVATQKKNLETLRENDILKMYVDSGVLSVMNRDEYLNILDQNEIIDGSVCFIDICGFTSLSEDHEPDQVVKALNRYFDIIVEQIEEFDGRVDKFIGDAVMAVFTGDHHKDRALDAAVHARNAIKSITEEESGLKDYTPQISLGLNSGSMLSGNIGSTTLRRLDFTVIGDVVNTAQRLESKAKPGQILVTDKFYDSVKEFFNGKPIGEITVKNKKAPLTVVEVLE